MTKAVDATLSRLLIYRFKNPFENIVGKGIAGNQNFLLFPQ